jgi:dipeptidyl aminopeptidase/acylaminoacyl peptidase
MWHASTTRRALAPIVIVLSLFVMILGNACGGPENTPSPSRTPSSAPPSTLTAEATGAIQRPSLMAFRSDRDSNAEIYTMNVDGSAQTRLTNHPSEDDAPAWSPDGKQVSFTSGRDGSMEESEIYVMDADGS